MQDMRSRHEIKLIVLLIILIAIVFTFWGVLFNIFNEDDNLENKLVFPINSKIKQITLETPKSNSDWNYTICYTNGEWKYRNSIVLSQVAAYSIAETVKNTSEIGRAHV